MPEFLDLVAPSHALRVFMNALPNRQAQSEGPLHQESVPTEIALGRVTAAAVLAAEALPAFNRATVDGYAVRAADTFGAGENMPAYLGVCGEVPMGAAPPFALNPAQAALIHTGGMLPQGADAVVMIENTQVARPGEIEVLKAAAPGENILLTGEDVAIGQEVIPAGVRLRPAEIGGLMALGITSVQVALRPKIAILSSGDEVVPPHAPLQMGQVRDVNSYSLSALIEQAGGAARRYGIIPDREEDLQAGLRQALADCDAVIVTAGSSASVRDFTSRAINSIGKPGVLVHGVNVRPGKPTILAVCDGKAIIGLPGNPVSALVIAGLFVIPLIRYLLAETERPRPLTRARLSTNLASQAGREDWVPVKLHLAGHETTAEPVFYKSNLIFMLSQADGLLCIPADATGLAAGDSADVWLI